MVAAGLHTPVSAGVCPVTDGTGSPFATLFVHVAVGVSQYCVAALQSLSTLQPPDFSHVPFALHAPERQTVLPDAAGVQGPSPSLKPHFESVSQTPERQTATPDFAGVQVPSLLA